MDTIVASCHASLEGGFCLYRCRREGERVGSRAVT